MHDATGGKDAWRDRDFSWKRRIENQEQLRRNGYKNILGEASFSDRWNETSPQCFCIKLQEQ
jgi:hypothetical protein